LAETLKALFEELKKMPGECEFFDKCGRDWCEEHEVDDSDV
jgi:hypothetical protein